MKVSVCSTCDIVILWLGLSGNPFYLDDSVSFAFHTIYVIDVSAYGGGEYPLENLGSTAKHHTMAATTTLMSATRWKDIRHPG